MLDAGANVDEKLHGSITALSSAILENRRDIFTLLLSRGADLNIQGPECPLVLACRRPHFLEPLTKAGADPKLCPGLIECAVRANSVEAVKYLISIGCDPNGKTNGFMTAVTSAIAENRPQLLALVLASGADPNLKGHDHPIYMAASKPALLKLLVSAGVNLSEPKGVMEKAVVMNSIDAVRYPLDQGIDPNEKVGGFFSPLTTAVREGRGEILDLLITRGVDLNAKGEDWTLRVALRRPALLKRLLDAGADAKMKEYIGIIELAVVANKLDSVKLLVEAGVGIEDKMHGLFSPLSTAVRDGREPIVKYLVEEAGAGVNTAGEHLPLVMAVIRGRDELATYLLDKGADPELRFKGRNAVMQAVELNKDGMLKKFLANGRVDLELVDELGRTALDIAAAKGYDGMVGVLIEHM